MNNKNLSIIAMECARLVDCHDWKLSAAKAEFKKRTGIRVVARSKDKFVGLMISFSRGLDRGVIEPDGIKVIK